MPDQRLVCRICNRPVDRIFHATHKDQPKEEWILTGYMHAARLPDEPHEPEPMPADEAEFIDQVCDFCGRPDIAWIFEVEDTPRQFQILSNVSIYDSAWAACEHCAKQIQKPDMDAQQMAVYVSKRHPNFKRTLPAIKREMTKELAKLYQHFFDTKKDNPMRLSDYIR